MPLAASGNKLIKIFAEESLESSLDNPMSTLKTLKIKTEPIFYTKDSEEERSSSEEENVYYAKKQPYHGEGK